MKTVKLEVRAPEGGMNEFVQAWRSGKAQRTARIGFATPELLWKVLSVKRWELLKALLAAGLLNRTDTGHIELPYVAVKVKFLLRAAQSSACLQR